MDQSTTTPLRRTLQESLEDLFWSLDVKTKKKLVAILGPDAPPLDTHSPASAELSSISLPDAAGPSTTSLETSSNPLPVTAGLATVIDSLGTSSPEWKEGDDWPRKGIKGAYTACNTCYEAKKPCDIGDRLPSGCTFCARNGKKCHPQARILARVLSLKDKAKATPIETYQSHKVSEWKEGNIPWPPGSKGNKFAKCTGCANSRCDGGPGKECCTNCKRKKIDCVPYFAIPKAEVLRKCKRCIVITATTAITCRRTKEFAHCQSCHDAGVTCEEVTPRPLFFRKNPTTPVPSYIAVLPLQNRGADPLFYSWHNNPPNKKTDWAAEDDLALIVASAFEFTADVQLMNIKKSQGECRTHALRNYGILDVVTDIIRALVFPTCELDEAIAKIDFSSVDQIYRALLANIIAQIKDHRLHQLLPPGSVILPVNVLKHNQQRHGISRYLSRTLTLIFGSFYRHGSIPWTMFPDEFLPYSPAPRDQYGWYKPDRSPRTPHVRSKIIQIFTRLRDPQAQLDQGFLAGIIDGLSEPERKEIVLTLYLCADQRIVDAVANPPFHDIACIWSSVQLAEARMIVQEFESAVQNRPRLRTTSTTVRLFQTTQPAPHPVTPLDDIDLGGKILTDLYHVDDRAWMPYGGAVILDPFITQPQFYDYETEIPESARNAPLSRLSAPELWRKLKADVISGRVSIELLPGANLPGFLYGYSQGRGREQIKGGTTTRDVFTRAEEWAMHCPNDERVWILAMRTEHAFPTEKVLHDLLELESFDRPRGTCQWCPKKHSEIFLMDGPLREIVHKFLELCRLAEKLIAGELDVDVYNRRFITPTKAKKVPV